MTARPPIVDIMMSRFGREYELRTLVAQLANAPDLLSAVVALEKAVPTLVDAQDATFVSGRRRHQHHGHMVVQPIGASAALVARRAPHAAPFGSSELAALAAIASTVAPTMEQLLARARMPE